MVRSNIRGGGIERNGLVAKCGELCTRCRHPMPCAPCRVFHERPRRPAFADESDVLSEEAGLWPVDPGSPADAANVLAGEPSSDNVNWPDIVGVQVTHIAEAGHGRPVLAEHGAAVWVDFAEGDGSHSCPLEPETESTDAAEEVKNPH